MQKLYIISCKDNYKIGVTNDVNSRVAQLAVGNPFKLKVIDIFEFPNASCVESALHQKFESKVIRGEWFELCPDDLVDIHQICKALGGVALKTGGEDVYKTKKDINAQAYKTMFERGWRMSTSDSTGKYWCWRRGSGENREYLHGGVIASLPLSMDEMRSRYGGRHK